MRRNPERGFSVIEALVAVAVLAIALVPLIGLQIQVSRDYSKQAQVRAAIDAQRNALAVLRDINMMSEPSGALRLTADRTLRWKATRRSKIVRSTDRGSGDGDFDVALYSVAVLVETDDRRPVTDFSIDQLGWRPIAGGALTRE